MKGTDVVMRRNICAMKGIVIKGRQLGRTIGFPTANLSLNSDVLSIEQGVFGVQVFRGANPYYGVMNVGRRPTLDDGLPLTSEVHLLDFNENIYGEELGVVVCFHIRKEEKFNNLNELKQQIDKDIAYSREYFEKYKIIGCSV
ncbi:riboflavin kinase [Neobacillus sp. BF23-41]|uniref:riboflavin kinase n=1 Tax=Neobacillus sp. BF23-41 TaxID=3240280 RepID=UPI0034E580D7